MKDLGKLPPQATDLEEVVLGAIMIESDAIYRVSDIITSPSLLYKDCNQKIYEAILSLHADSEPIDILTVTSKLKKTGKLESVGGAYHITDLTNRVNSSANIEAHARIIVEMAIKRQLIVVGNQMVSKAYDDTTDPLNLLDEANADMCRVQDHLDRRKALGTRELINQSIKFTEEAGKKPDGVTGIPSKHRSINRLLGGYQDSDLIIIAARPGMGKTSYVINELGHAAINLDIPTAIFSLEMSALQLIQRVQAGECQIELDKIRRGIKEPYLWERYLHKSTQISNKPLFIDDTPGLTLLEFKSKLRRLIVEHGVKMAAVDYLQLMDGVGDNRTNEISYLSRGLKKAAKEFNIPIIALSQLSRAVEQRGGDKKPQLSDLRDSGSIEQDADVVQFIYRPEYYGIVEDAEGNSTSGKASVITAKNRHGRLDEVNINFVGKFQYFYEDGYFENTGLNSFYEKDNDLDEPTF